MPLMRFWRYSSVFASLLLAGMGSFIASTPVLGSIAHQTGSPAIISIGAMVNSSTSVTFQASLSPNGADTTYVFDYGLTTSYGQTTPTQDAGSGTSSVTVTAQVTGLLPSTSYHYRIVASNSAGSMASPDSTTTTQTAVTTTTQPPTRKRATVQATGTATAVPVAQSGGSSLNAIACANRSKCFAVGSTGVAGARFSSLIERWTGRSFIVTPSPEIGETLLAGISCGAPTFCVAIGRSGEPSSTTFVEAWNGRSWTRQESPSPPSGGNGDLLNAVSCSSANSCMAVGLTNAGTPAEAPLAEQWVRGRWSVLKTPDPGAAGFYSVACPVATDCWAVGDSHSFSSRPPSLIEHWNGLAWSVVASPSPEVQNLLYAVACHTSALCFAGGSGMVLRLKGTSWQLIPTSNMTTIVDAITCASAKVCWFVGSGGVGLWNGRVFSTVQRSGHSNVDLLGVACSSATHCLGTGESGGRRTSAAAYELAP